MNYVKMASPYKVSRKNESRKFQMRFYMLFRKNFLKSETKKYKKEFCNKNEKNFPICFI